MDNFIVKLIRSNSGYSSKRFTGLLATACICIIAFIDLFTNLTVEEYVITGLIAIAMTALGSTAYQNYADNKFGKKDKKQDEPPIEQM